MSSRERGTLTYQLKSAMLPSVLLILMGSIDCATTVIGTLYFGATELNPVLAGVVSNIPLFMLLKLTATFCIAGTYLLGHKILHSTQDKTTKSFKIGNTAMNLVYAGLIAFLALVVVNNFTVLMA
jgi:hypothetical protein